MQQKDQESQPTGRDAVGKRSEWLATRPGNVQILFSENPIGASLFKNAQSRAGKHSDIVFRKTNFPFLTRAGNAQILFFGVQLVHVAPDVERTLQLHDNDCSSSIEQYQAVGKKRLKKSPGSPIPPTQRHSRRS
jgi:hypothetical protein